jgi:hypothetical protein
MSSSALARFGAALFAASALAGCITAEYGPIGANGGFGYSDAHNADGSYTIRVVAMHAAQAHEFWDRRATDLCAGASYRKNIFRADIPVVSQTGYAANPYNPGYGGSYTQDVYGPLILEGYAHCEPPTAQPANETAATPTPEAPPAQTQP